MASHARSSLAAASRSHPHPREGERAEGHSGADTGIYTSLAELIALQHAARGFSLLAKPPQGSPLLGRRATRLRGRGLAFEELRDYRPGDDPRHIDWKVTARTSRPHSRVFTEERERPVLLVVDQRLSMFFGTRVQMKSVSAAELAAVLAWQVATAGDRLGALVFSDAGLTEIEPRRERASLLRTFATLVDYNRRLGVSKGLEHAPGRLDAVLAGLARRARHDWIIVIISDFHDYSAETRANVRRLARHNDVIAAFIEDPIAAGVPARRQIVVSDTRDQIVLDTTAMRTRAAVDSVGVQRRTFLAQLRRELDVPLLALSSNGDMAGQLRAALGFAPAITSLTG